MGANIPHGLREPPHPPSSDCYSLHEVRGHSPRRLPQILGGSKGVTLQSCEARSKRKAGPNRTWETLGKPKEDGGGLDMKTEPSLGNSGDLPRPREGLDIMTHPSLGSPCGTSRPKREAGYQDRPNLGPLEGPPRPGVDGYRDRTEPEESMRTLSPNE